MNIDKIPKIKNITHKIAIYFGTLFAISSSSYIPVSSFAGILSGFIIKMLSKMPQKGDEFAFNDYLFIVDSVEEHRIDKIRIIPISTQE